MKRVMSAIILLSILMSGYLMAESKDVLNLQIKDTVAKFETKAKGGKAFLDQKCAGYLVMPNIYKAGFIVGGEYGEGGLVVDGNVTDYYSIMSASFGLQAGAQKRSMIVAFITKSALDSFRKSNKWKVGVDGSIAIADWGGGIDLSTVDFKKTVVAFIFDEKGLMASISLDGSIFTKIKK